MKNRKHRKSAAVLTVLLILTAMFLTACGGGSGSYAGYSASADTEMPMAMPEEAYYDDEAYDFGGMNLTSNYSGGAAAQSARSAAPTEKTVTEAEEPDEPESGSDDTLKPRKLIFRASLTLESTEFDATAAAIADLTERLGGYFSDTSSGERGSSHRWANYTIRVPSARFDEFLDQAGELANETWRNVTREDISENYYDTDGRLKTQQTKLNRLRELLEKAETVEDMITIESAIAETEYEIDSLSGELRHYDSLVNYSTIDISLEEVYRLTEVEQVPDTYFTRLGYAFKDGLSNFGDWLEDLTIAVAYGWIWIALLIVILVVLVKLGKAGKLTLKRRETLHVSDKKTDAAPPQEPKN